MRGTRATLGTLAAAALLTAAAATAATAATGALTVNGTVYTNPSGCIELAPEGTLLTVTNNTNKVATVYDGPGCDTGTPDDPVLPGKTETITGASVILP
jgi:hypothetical protein